jgi:hypothetical protein
VLLNVPID